MTFKHLFGFLAAVWIFFWLGSAVTIGSLMGDSIPQLLLFVGMAFLPPVLIYLLLFRLIPLVIRKFKKQAAQI